MIMTLSLVNAVLSVLCSTLISYSLVKYRKYLTLEERWGKSLVASALLLTIVPIVQNGGSPYVTLSGSPFNLWPSTLLRSALLIFFLGRLKRHYRHDKNNDMSVEQARAHLAAKGKL